MSEAAIQELYRRCAELQRERDEARSFAKGVYRWGPREQWETWEKSLPWLSHKQT